MAGLFGGPKNGNRIGVNSRAGTGMDLTSAPENHHVTPDCITL